MLTGMLQRVDQLKGLLESHSTTILTGVGVGGTIATSVLTGRASMKAARLIDDEKRKFTHSVKVDAVLEQPDTDVSELAEIDGRLGKFEIVKLVWTLYLPPVAAGVTTITAIIVANKISSKKIAALAVAGGISERALQEYKEKVVEKLGDRQNQKIHDEIAQDRVNANPPGEVIVAGNGDVLCYDMLTGRYFMSTVETIKQAENKINHEMLNTMGASLAEFHDEIGLPATSYTDSVGWSGGGDLVHVVLSTALSPDKRPCITVDFDRPPVLEYSKMY